MSQYRYLPPPPPPLSPRRIQSQSSSSSASLKCLCHSPPVIEIPDSTSRKEEENSSLVPSSSGEDFASCSSAFRIAAVADFAFCAKAAASTALRGGRQLFFLPSPLFFFSGVGGWMSAFSRSGGRKRSRRKKKRTPAFLYPLWRCCFAVCVPPPPILSLFLPLPPLFPPHSPALPSCVLFWEVGVEGAKLPGPQVANLSTKLFRMGKA